MPPCIRDELVSARRTPPLSQPLRRPRLLQYAGHLVQAGQGLRPLGFLQHGPVLSPGRVEPHPDYGLQVAVGAERVRQPLEALERVGGVIPHQRQVRSRRLGTEHRLLA